MRKDEVGKMYLFTIILGSKVLVRYFTLPYLN